MRYIVLIAFGFGVFIYYIIPYTLHIRIVSSQFNVVCNFIPRNVDVLGGGSFGSGIGMASIERSHQIRSIEV